MILTVKFKQINYINRKKNTMRRVAEPPLMSVISPSRG